MRGEFASGWRVLLASFMGAAIGVSSLYFYSLGIFIKPMQAEFDWTRGEASLGALVGTACAALMSAPTGWLIDRVGSLRLAVIALVLLAGGFAALGAATHDLPSFLIITAVISLITVGSTPLPFTRLIVSNFERNRGLALGLTLAGVGVGAILVPRVLTPFVAEHGWRNGYLALAAVIAAATPVVWLLLRGAKENPPPNPADSNERVLAVPAYFILTPLFLIASVAVLGTVVHFVPMLTDAGLAPARAGAIASLIGVAAIAGRLIAGFMLDRAPAKWVGAVLFLMSAAGLAILAAGGADKAALGAVILGLAIGSEVDLLAFLVSRHFAPAIYGRAYGAIYTAFLIGGALGPYVAGQLFDRFGAYSQWLLLASALLTLAAMFALLLPKPASRGAA